MYAQIKSGIYILLTSLPRGERTHDISSSRFYDRVLGAANSDDKILCIIGHFFVYLR